MLLRAVADQILGSKISSSPLRVLAMVVVMVMMEEMVMTEEMVMMEETVNQDLIL